MAQICLLWLIIMAITAATAEAKTNASVASATDACPPLQSDNTTDFIGGLAKWGNSTYFVGRESKDWQDARQVCQNFCGDLASIETKEELEVVKAEVTRVVEPGWGLWVGAKRISGMKDFLWLTGSTLREEDEAWYSGMPGAADSGSDCVWMRPGGSTSYTFYDYPCTVTLRSVCEMPDPQTTTAARTTASQTTTFPGNSGNIKLYQQPIHVLLPLMFYFSVVHFFY